MSNGKIQRLLSFILCIVMLMLTGCSAPGGNKTSPTPAGEQKPVTILPTYTPTPIPYKDPVDLDVDGDALGTYPGFTGEYEQIWDGATPIEIKRVVRGKGNTTASYRFFWTEKCLYVQVYVLDDTPDTSGSTYLKQDSVVFYLNEDGNKNKKYSVGDAYYVVNRDGVISIGTGANAERIFAITYEVEGGYYVEASIPLLTITGQYDHEIGFDVRVNNANKGRLVHALQWSDKSGYTDTNLRGVGTLVFE